MKKDITLLALLLMTINMYAQIKFSSANIVIQTPKQEVYDSLSNIKDGNYDYSYLAGQKSCYLGVVTESQFYPWKEHTNVIYHVLK